MFYKGKRISLISMKEIRYEGVLYSINEQNSTVALQNVRSYGTEGREQTNPTVTFVPPQAAVHPYLLFRGCDIKDLHVHDTPQPTATTAEAPPTAAAVPPPPVPAAVTSQPPATVVQHPPANASVPVPPPPPPASELPVPSSLPPPPAAPSTAAAVVSGSNEKESRESPATTTTTKAKSSSQQQGGTQNTTNNRRPKNKGPAHQVGTGASLLNRKARGTVEGGTLFFYMTLIGTVVYSFPQDSHRANSSHYYDDDDNNYIILFVSQALPSSKRNLISNRNLKN